METSALCKHHCISLQEVFTYKYGLTNVHTCSHAIIIINNISYNNTFSLRE